MPLGLNPLHIMFLGICLIWKSLMQQTCACKYEYNSGTLATEPQLHAVEANQFLSFVCKSALGVKDSL